MSDDFHQIYAALLRKYMNCSEAVTVNDAAEHDVMMEAHCVSVELIF